MKLFKLALVSIVLVAFAAAPVVRADDTPSSGGSAAEANLTPEQQAKILDLRKEEHKSIKRIKADKKISQADKVDQIKTLKEQLEKDIAAVKAGK